MVLDSVFIYLEFMKKLVLKLLSGLILCFVGGCSFANKSTVIVPIESRPQGANIVIDGKNFGQTPAFVELRPSKNYKAMLYKQGYQPAVIDMEVWYSLRENQKTADNSRCVADASAMLFPYIVVLLFAPEKCSTFKQRDYFANLMQDFNENSTNSKNSYSQINYSY